MSDIDDNDRRLDDPEPNASAGDAQEAHRARKREQMRDWRRRNPDRTREQSRRHREKNRERLAEYAKAWREANKDKLREYKRNWIRDNAEAHRQHSRDSAARKRAKRAAEKRAEEARQRRNEQRRARYQENLAAEREKARTYYANNRDSLLAKAAQRRERYREANADGRYTPPGQKRRAAGLPNRRGIGLTPPTVRARHEEAAAEFFSRKYTRAQLKAMRADPDPPTHPALMLRHTRDNERARMAYIAAEEAENQRIQDALDALDPARRAERERKKAEQERKAAERVRRQAELDRMDAIARAINDKLRTQPRRTPRPDPAAPHQLPGGPTSTGLNR